MNFSCHTWTFHDLTLPEAFGTIARAGFRMVDLGSGQGFNTARAAAQPRDAAADARADLDLHGLTPADLYLMLPRITAGGSPAEDERREREIALFRALLPFAAFLSVPGITVSPGLAASVESTPDAGDAVDLFERAAESLRAMSAAARSAGIPLSIEPHLDSIASAPAATLRLLEAVPGLQITLDWAELVCQNIPYDECLRLLPFTRHIHLRGATRGKLGVPLEKNTVDFDRIIDDLMAHGYEGAVCVEILPIPGRHGSQKVNALSECARVRDVLRARRDLPRKEMPRR